MVFGRSSLAASLAIHALLALVLVAALGGGHRHNHEPPSPAPLVYVEPAALLVPGRGEVGEAENPETRPPKAESSENAPLPTSLTVKPPPPKRRRVPPFAAEAPAVPAARPPAEAPAAPVGSFAEAPPSTDSAVASHGLEHGVPGGLGSAPLALRDVASPPELVSRVLPEYPSQARAREIEGQVVLEVVLDPSGRVEEPVHVLRSVPLLDSAAIAAVRQWRFRPARDRTGRPVRVIMEIPVRFVLR